MCTVRCKQTRQNSDMISSTSLLMHLLLAGTLMFVCLASFCDAQGSYIHILTSFRPCSSIPQKGAAASQIAAPAKRVEDDIIFFYSAEFEHDGEDRSLSHRSGVYFLLHRRKIIEWMRTWSRQCRTLIRCKTTL